MLTLPIKKKWFDMIINGEKKEKIIDEMACYVYLDKHMREEMKKDIYDTASYNCVVRMVQKAKTL